MGRLISLTAYKYNEPSDAPLWCACEDCNAAWHDVNGPIFVPPPDCLAFANDANNRNAYSIIKRQRMIRLHALMYSEAIWIENGSPTL